jgi:hypothetical protein
MLCISLLVLAASLDQENADGLPHRAPLSSAGSSGMTGSRR